MWTEIITNIQRISGMTDGQIAAVVGVDQTSISRLRNGTVADCKYKTGKAIMALHDRMMKKRA